METACFKNDSKDAQGLADKTWGWPTSQLPACCAVKTADQPPGHPFRTDSREASGPEWICQQNRVIEPHLTGHNDDSCAKQLV